jgi:hypothetical protein
MQRHRFYADFPQVKTMLSPPARMKTLLRILGGLAVLVRFGLLLDRMIGSDFEQGSAKLKQLAEAAPK